MLNRLKSYILGVASLLMMCGVATAAEDTTSSSEGDFQSIYADAQVLDDATPKRYKISKINIHGVESFNRKLLTAAAGLNEGDSITLPSPFIATAIERLWSQQRYSDVNIAANILGDELELDLYLKEQPRVFNWEIEGVRDGQKKEIKEKLNLRRNSELSEYVISKNTELIKKYFSDKGFRNTEVDMRIEDDTLRKNLVNVTFIIDRKDRVKVEEIIFEGNEAFEDKKLRKTFKKTNQGGFGLSMFKSRKFKEDLYKEDKDLLIDFYNSKGYRNATVVSDSVYNVSEDRLGVKLKVSEGNKYYLRNITWVGNSVHETEMLQRIFGLSSGDTYDKKTMNKRLGVGADANPDDISVMSLYQNDGYLMSQIDPSEIIIGADSIDLELKIFEGRPFTVNEVGISGNLRVDDEIIRRELYTRPGELYNRSLLMQTIRTLGPIGHFNPEAIMPDIAPISNELVNINWALEEQASDQFNLAGGWGSGSFVGSVGITLNNLSVKDFFAPGAWRPYPMGQNQKLSIQAQTNGTYYKAASLSFTDPWLGGKKPNSFTVSMHYSDQNNAYYAWSESTQYFRTFGAAVGLGKRLTWPDPYFTLYGEVGYDRYMLKDWYSFLMEDGDANLISLKLVLARNSVDQQRYPRRGTNCSSSTQVTPPYSLFDGKDYSNKKMSDQERYKFIEFHKWDLDMTWYQSFLKNSNLVLMLRARMGYLGNYDKHKVSPFERYEVGGDGMS